MVLPNWIGSYRHLMVQARPYDPEKDDVHDLLLREEVKEAMLQEEFKGDKGRAVKANAEQILKVKSFLKQAKDSQNQKRLEKWLDSLYTDRFNLLRNEILDDCKDEAGLIDTEKLARFRGSPEYCKRKEKEKQKQNKH